MIDIYRTNINNGKLEKIDEITKGCWINIVRPTPEEITNISKSIDINEELLKYPLDISEKAHIDAEDTEVLIVVDAPATVIKKEKKTYTTIPLGMLIVRDDIFITISQVKINVIENIITTNRANFIFTDKKSRFVFQILFDMAKDYIRYLTYISQDLDKFEEKLENSISNKELLNIMNFEKTMIYFDASLKANQVVLEKLNRGKIIKLYEEDEDILEDTLIESRQAIEMLQTYSQILNGIIDVFGIMVSNKLNMVIKFLTSITIIIAIPTMVASFLGMNVEFPFSTKVDGFVIVMLVSVIFTILITVWLKRKDMF